MKSKTVILFDTETTDLVKNELVPLDRQPSIIEFAAVLGSMDENGDGEELETLEFLCNPGVPIDSKIEEITGIKNEDLIGKDKFFHYSEQVKSLFNKAECRCAHNLIFDENMLSFEFQRIAQPHWQPARQRRLCTVEATEHLLGRRMPLGELHEWLFAEKFTGAHRALVDVRANWKIFRELQKRKII
jgi:DNA polymerase III epsilon subunit-like protein